MTDSLNAIQDATKEMAGKHHVFMCAACDEHPKFNFDEMDKMKMHMLSEHGDESTKGTKEAILHGDGREYFWTVYSWTTLGGSNYLESIRQRRTGENAMWWDAA